MQEMNREKSGNFLEKGGEGAAVLCAVCIVGCQAKNGIE